MNIKKVLHSEMLWGMLAKIVIVMGNFLLLPIVLHYLDKEMVSLYFIFMSLSMFINIVDFGFNPTLTRNFAYAYAGAKQIQAEGLVSEYQEDINWALVADLFLVAQRIYFYLALITLAVFYTLGFYYVYHIVNESHISVVYASVCWLIYSTATVVTVYYVYISTMVQGRGDVNLSNKIILISRLSGIALTVVLLMLHYNLLGISISVILTAILERYLFYKYAFNDKHFVLKNLTKLPVDKFKQYLRIIMSTSTKTGIVTLGAYLITRSTMLIATAYLGLYNAADYVFSIQVVSVVTTVSGVLVMVYLPKLNQFAVANKAKQLQLFCFANLVTLSFYIFSSLVVIFIGGYLLELIHAQTKLIGTIQLIVLFTIYLLEVQHSNFALFITTDNKVPFVGAAIYSGIAVVILSLLLMNFTHLGIWGLILSQGVVQLAYNNWYWIYYVCKKNNINYLRMFKIGFNYAIQKK